MITLRSNIQLTVKPEEKNRGKNQRKQITLKELLTSSHNFPKIKTVNLKTERAH